MKLFHINKNTVTVLSNKSYKDQSIHGFGEAMLEQFLVDYPELIPSEELSQEDPPSFIVVRNQAGVTPGSMDILLLDNHAVPTVIEAKLSENREIRRYVLAQGLEYLSSLRNEWTPERFLDEGNRFWSGKQADFQSKFKEKFGNEFDDEYAQKLRANLETARMRLLIVADKIPSELRTVIEFLNDTSTFDVYGVEVLLFAEPGTDEIILAPKIIGISEKAKEKKQVLGMKWNENRFFDELVKNVNENDLAIVNELYALAKEIPDGLINWGVGKVTGSFTAKCKAKGERWSLFSVYSNGTLSVNIGWNYTKLEKLGLNLSEEYRDKTNNLLKTQLNEKTWKNGWQEIPVAKVQGKVVEFRSLVINFIQSVESA